MAKMLVLTGENKKVKKVKSNKIIDILVETGLASSNSEARRLIEQKGVKMDDQVIDNINLEIQSGEHLIQKGKRFFVKVIVD